MAVRRFIPGKRAEFPSAHARKAVCEGGGCVFVNNTT